MKDNPSLTHVTVVLYTRQGCHLCDDAHRLLASRQEKFGFRLLLVDIDFEAVLVERYGSSVPVVEVNGVERFRGPIAPGLLDRLFLRLASQP